MFSNIEYICSKVVNQQATKLCLSITCNNAQEQKPPNGKTQIRQGRTWGRHFGFSKADKFKLHQVEVGVE